MIIPSFRLYHFAVKLIWKSMLVLTFCFWTGITVLFYLVNHVAIWVEYGNMVVVSYDFWNLFSFYGCEVDGDDYAS